MTCNKSEIILKAGYDAGYMDVDTEFNADSDNPVANKTLTPVINYLKEKIENVADSKIIVTDDGEGNVTIERADSEDINITDDNNGNISITF